MWQKCPICNGTGLLPTLVDNVYNNTCPTCNGARIISELTGNPPVSHQQIAVKPEINKRQDQVCDCEICTWFYEDKKR
jgi:DnaJ-class molecular chaperone